MNAAVIEVFDRPPRYTEFVDPVAGNGEVLIEVKTAGLHPIVKGLANGSHYGSSGELPFVPGVDGVGRLEDGSRVYFGATRSPYGTFAERGVTASWMCVPLPEALDDVTAAALANPAMSSWAALTARAKFVSGESVLILGATGVAGQLAVQIARRLGVKRVVAAGRNAKALAELAVLGADAVISLEQEARCAGRFVSPGTGGCEDRCCARLSVGTACGMPAASYLAKGIRPCGIAYSLCADRRERGTDHFACCGDAAQFGAGAAGKRLRQRVSGTDYAGCWGVLSGSGEEAVQECGENRFAARC